jgi:hypothetical protein
MLLNPTSIGKYGAVVVVYQHSMLEGKEPHAQSTSLFPAKIRAVDL